MADHGMERILISVGGEFQNYWWVIQPRSTKWREGAALYNLVLLI